MKKLIGAFSVLALLFFLSSCQKEDRFIDHTSDGSTTGVGFASVLSDAVALDVTPDTPFLVIPVNAFFSGGSGASGQVSVKIKVDASVVDAYNATTGASQVSIPEGSIVTVPTSIDIASGSHEGSANIVLSLDTLLKYGTAFAVGVEITDVSGASVTSRSEQVYLINIRNIFDGDYTVTGSFTDFFFSTITDDGIYPIDAYLITTGANSVQFYDNTYQISGKVINSSGALSYYGGFDPVFTIDLSTGNVTKVTNALENDPANTHGRTAELNESGVNKYDFSTKTLQVTYDIVQGDLGNAVRTTFDETYTYVGPR